MVKRPGNKRNFRPRERETVWGNCLRRLVVKSRKGAARVNVACMQRGADDMRV